MRFILRDTNSVPRNKYAYANGNPIMEDDPSGMIASWVKSFLSTGAGIIADAAIGFVTGGLATDTGVLVGGIVAESVGGAAAQSGVSSLLDQKSFFNESTLENMATGAALGAFTIQA